MDAAAYAIALHEQSDCEISLAEARNVVRLVPRKSR
jgi:hypothetical protein